MALSAKRKEELRQEFRANFKNSMTDTLKAAGVSPQERTELAQQVVDAAFEKAARPTVKSLRVAYMHARNNMAGSHIADLLGNFLSGKEVAGMKLVPRKPQPADVAPTRDDYAIEWL